jgi:hypothetical protein
LCFTAAIQITIQYGQAAESETHINNKKIHLKKIQRDNIKKIHPIMGFWRTEFFLNFFKKELSFVIAV